MHSSTTSPIISPFQSNDTQASPSAAVCYKKKRKSEMPPSSNPNFQGTYLSQPYEETRIWPFTFEEFKETRIASVRIEDIPTRLEEKHHQVWYIWEPDNAIVPLTCPLKESIQIADMLYTVHTNLHKFPGNEDEKVDIDHAFIRLMELWERFESILCYWAKKEMPRVPEADASDGLYMIEEARFIPIMTRFYAALESHSRPSFIEELREFVTTTIGLIRELKELILEVALS